MAHARWSLILCGLLLGASAAPAMAQSLNNSQRMFLFYNQMSAQRQQRQLQQNQQQLARQFQQFSQGSRQPFQPSYVDPSDAYLRSVEMGSPDRSPQSVGSLRRGLIGGPTGGVSPYRRPATFQSQTLYFAPAMAPLR